MTTITIEEHEVTTDAGTWYVDVEMDVSVNPGYEGSHSYHAASDADYYGEGPEVDGIEDVRILGAWDKDTEEEVELAPWEERILADNLNIEDDVIIDAVPEDEGDCRW